MLNYNYKHVTHKRNGYHGRQVANSVRPSTYQERYHFRREGLSLAVIITWILVFLLLGWALQYLIFE